MCVRCGTGKIAWCTDPTRHGDDAVEQPCPYRQPEHDAPCIGVAEHDGEHRDEHGCTWVTGDAQAAWCAGYDLARAIGLALDADRAMSHESRVEFGTYDDPALARQFMLGLSAGAQIEAPPPS